MRKYRFATRECASRERLTLILLMFASGIVCVDMIDATHCAHRINASFAFFNVVAM